MNCIDLKLTPKLDSGSDSAGVGVRKVKISEIGVRKKKSSESGFEVKNVDSAGP